MQSDEKALTRWLRISLLNFESLPGIVGGFARLGAAGAETEAGHAGAGAAI
jgi:hypothetical protein